MTLIHGNCLEKLSDIADGSIDLVLTDPPYNIGNFMKERNCGMDRIRDNFFVEAGWDNLDEQTWLENMDNFFHILAKKMKPKSSVLMFMSLLKIGNVVELATKHGFYYKTTGVWHKSNPMPRNMNLHFINSLEGWIYFTYGSKTGTFNNDGKAIHDFIENPVASKSERAFGTHPTQKPVSLMESFVKLLSNENDTVLDPFMGSGSTGVACKNLNRQFVGIELNEDYFNIATNRIR